MENDRRWKTSNDYEESNHGNHSKHGFSIQLLQQQLSCSKVMRCEGTSSLTFHTRRTASAWKSKRSSLDKIHDSCSAKPLNPLSLP
jgi:hypothetical protein